MTEKAADLLRAFGTKQFEKKCLAFIKTHGSLKDAYSKARNLLKVPVSLPDGSTVALTPRDSGNEEQNAYFASTKERNAL